MSALYDLSGLRDRLIAWREERGTLCDREGNDEKIAPAEWEGSDDEAVGILLDLEVLVTKPPAAMVDTASAETALRKIAHEIRSCRTSRVPATRIRAEGMQAALLIALFHLAAGRETATAVELREQLLNGTWKGLTS